jgi:hypothetical protein
MEEMHLAIGKFMFYGMLRYIDWEVLNGISKECSAVSAAKWYQNDEGPQCDGGLRVWSINAM